MLRGLGAALASSRPLGYSNYTTATGTSGWSRARALGVGVVGVAVAGGVGVVVSDTAPTDAAAEPAASLNEIKVEDAEGLDDASPPVDLTTSLLGNASQWAAIHDYLTGNENIVECSQPHSPIARVHINSIGSNDPAEDAHEVLVCKSSPVAFLGVYDGHSGRAAADFARDNLVKFVRHAIELESHKRVPSIEAALENGFMNADEVFLGQALSDPKRHRDGLAGACVSFAFVAGRDLFIANAGDCRAVLGTRRNFDGENEEGELVAVELSIDQHGENPSEIARIRTEHPLEYDAIWRGRVKGRLQPTRGLGDGKYKKSTINDAGGSSRIPPPYTPPYTTAKPEITHWHLAEGDEFLVIACDGLWDAYDSGDVIQMVEAHHGATSHLEPPANTATALIAAVLRDAAQALILPTEAPTSEPVKRLVDLPARRRRRLYDDVTVMVVFFDQSRLREMDKSGASGAAVRFKDVGSESHAEFERVQSLIDAYGCLGVYDKSRSAVRAKL